MLAEPESAARGGAGTRWTAKGLGAMPDLPERDAWLMVVGAAMLSSGFRDRAAHSLAGISPPEDLREVWRYVMAGDRPGAAVWFANRGVPSGERGLGVALLEKLIDDQTDAAVRALVRQAEFARHLDRVELRQSLAGVLAKIEAAELAATAAKHYQPPRAAPVSPTPAAAPPPATTPGKEGGKLPGHTNGTQGAGQPPRKP